MAAPAFHPGRVYQIDLEDGWHCYARMLAESPYFAFHDWRTREPNNDLVEVVRSPVLFVLAVRWHHHIRGRRWTPVGTVPLEEVWTPIPDQFIQRPPFLDRPIVISPTGVERAATLEECIGLERAAVWDAHHVEQRLADHFAGRPNDYVEMSRVEM